MTVSGDREDEPRRDRLEALVRLDDKVSEAAEAAAKAASHAVEATKAAEAAAEARLARKNKTEVREAKAGRAAQKAKSAKSKAGRAAQAAKKASEQTGQHVPAVDEPTMAPGSDASLLELALTDAELERLRELATEQGVPVPQLARALLRQALEQSDD